MNFSLVGSRRQCKKLIKIVAESKEYSFVGGVKLTRLAFRTWHIEFEASRA